ncbi:hypothetical protein ACFL5A_04825 [Gemmatimonadota bacterium]
MNAQRGGEVPPLQEGAVWRRAAGLLLAILGGCAPPGMHPSAVPSGFEADSVIQATMESTRPPGPIQMVFRFRLREADLRFQGRGVARVEPPYRVRLDLFSNQGETLFQAALVEEGLRVPEWASVELAPPPPLLWAALGVFRPGPGWDYLGAGGGGNQVVILRYGDGGGGELRFHISSGELSRAELFVDGHLLEEVDLTFRGSPAELSETVYRNRAKFVELTFSLESVENVESFPPDIWNPGR